MNDSNNKTTLLILAAGMGSRYGGLKQLDHIGPSGETIIEYSIYDALMAGFNKFVFIIRDEFKEAFQSQITDKFSKKAEIVFVNQDVTTPISGIELNVDRVKPWGTGHAVLVAKDVISEPFAVINADDFYGRSAFHQMADFLRTEVNPLKHCIIGYILKNTLSENGYVSRGVCQVDSDHNLTAINERTKIKRHGDIVAYEDEGVTHEVSEDSIVSMNFWGFHQSIFEKLHTGFKDFLENYGTEAGKEYFIPLVADQCIADNSGAFVVKRSSDMWYGVTYKEDKESVHSALSQMTEEGIYPSPLFKAG
jgi:NDP-sugar pyrophosphorylase family protein